MPPNGSNGVEGLNLWVQWNYFLIKLEKLCRLRCPRNQFTPLEQKHQTFL